MTNELEAVLDRLVLMQQACVTDILGTMPDAVPVSVYTQGLPYWTNTITGGSVDLNSEAAQVVTYRITMTFVLSKVTENYEQGAEQIVHQVLPVVLIYFGQRRQLRRTREDTRLLELDPRGAVITGFQVDYNVPAGGTGDTNFGLDFFIEIPIYEQVENPFW